jgi:hypothetical protein
MPAVSFLLFYAVLLIRMFIPDSDFYPSRIPDLGSRPTIAPFFVATIVIKL